MCDGAYTVEELLTFEIEMFAALNFDLAQPYALQFLRRFASTKKDELDRQTYEGAKMLIELSVLGKSKSFNILLLYTVFVTSTS